MKRAFPGHASYAGLPKGIDRGALAGAAEASRIVRASLALFRFTMFRRSAGEFRAQVACRPANLSMARGPGGAALGAVASGDRPVDQPRVAKHS